MTDSRVAVYLGVIVLVGLALRVIAWLLTAPTMLVNDEFSYYSGAATLLKTGDLGLIRPPMTSILDAFAIHLFGPSKFVVRGTGVLFGTFTVALMYPVTAQIGGRRAGLIAAAITAVYPTLIGYTHYILSESYFLVFFLAAIYFALRLRRSFSPWTAGLTGIFCGLSALTREVGLICTIAIALAVVSAAWAHRQHLRRAVASAALVVALAAIVIAPWSLYLHEKTGDIALVSRTTWMNLYLGNTPAGTNATLRSIRQYWILGSTQTERESAARAEALQAISDRLPAWPFEKLRGIKALFWPSSYPAKRLLSLPHVNGASRGEWSYRFTWPRLHSTACRRAMAYPIGVSYVLVALAGMIGLTISRSRDARFLLFLVASLIAPVLLTFPSTRFRLPIECLFIVGTGLLLARGTRDWKRAHAGQRIAAIVALATTAAIIAAGSNAFMSRFHL